MKFFYKDQTAFTLVELLVIIAIIGILSTFVVVSLSGARSRSRDVKRISDVKTIQTALQLYSASFGSYPEIITAGDSIINPSNGTPYLAAVPSNPVPRNEGSCTNSDYTYIRTSPSSYYICFCLANNSGSIKAGINALSSDGKVSDCGCKIADRDGHEYNTVKIGSQCWMQENLNTGVQTDSSIPQADANGGNIQKYCYGNDVDTNCNTDGGLYQWHTAMALPQSCDDVMTGCTVNAVHQGICPTGWHIPSDAEWATLSAYAGGNDVSGKKLKIATPTWDGSDNYAFSALPAGMSDGGGFSTRTNIGYFWSTQFQDGEWPIASAIVLTTSVDAFSNESFNARTRGYSVRCLKD